MSLPTGRVSIDTIDTELTDQESERVVTWVCNSLHRDGDKDHAADAKQYADERYKPGTGKSWIEHYVERLMKRAYLLIAVELAPEHFERP